MHGHHGTHHVPPGQDLPLFNNRQPDEPADSQALPPMPAFPRTAPPNAEELSAYNQLRAFHLARLFLEDMLAAKPDMAGQVSHTRIRHGIAGSPATGGAVRLLLQRKLIHGIAHAKSAGLRRRSGHENLWAISDESRAKEWVAAHGGAGTTPPTPSTPMNPVDPTPEEGHKS